jgi:hypothetical protein
MFNGVNGLCLNNSGAYDASIGHIIRNCDSYRDGMLGRDFQETGDTNLWTYWPAGQHHFGMMGVLIEDCTVLYTGVRDDGYIPNEATDNATVGNGIWLDTSRGTSLSDGSIVRRILTQNTADSGIVEEKGCYNTYSQIVIDSPQQQTIDADKYPAGLFVWDSSEDAGTESHHNRFYHITILNSGSSGIKLTGWYGGEKAGSFANNEFKNIIVKDYPSFALIAENGAENAGNGSGNVYIYNSLGTEKTNFIKFGDVTPDTYAEWDTAYGGATYSVTSDPLLTSTYRLSAGSPAIDAGTPVFTAAQWLANGDAAGNHYVYGSAPDIGAYEFVSKKAVEDFPALVRAPVICPASNADCYVP